MRFRFRVEGPDTLINIDNRSFLTLEVSAVRDLIKALQNCERKASEYIEADRIITDSAFLMRTGAPFSLTDNKQMLDAAAVQAAHNRELRRHIPGSVKSREVFGLPRITKSKEQ